MKAIEKYFPVVLFIMLYKVVLTFESADEIFKYDHSNEGYWAVLSCGAVYYAVQGGSAFESADDILTWDPPNESYLTALSCGAVYCVSLRKAVETFASMVEILKCDTQIKATKQYFHVE